MTGTSERYLIGLYGYGHDVFGEHVVPFFDSVIVGTGLTDRRVSVVWDHTHRTPKYGSLKKMISSGKYTKIIGLGIYPPGAAEHLLQDPDAIFGFMRYPDHCWEVTVYLRELNDPHPYIVDLIRGANLVFRYGFATPIGAEPLPTAVVAGSGGEADLRGAAISDGGGAHNRDQIRDVFQFNFLSKEHLERKVENDTLIEWIHRGRGQRGHLEEVYSHFWLWHIPVDKIEKVRAALQSSAEVLIPLAQTHLH